MICVATTTAAGWSICIYKTIGDCQPSCEEDDPDDEQRHDDKDWRNVISSFAEDSEDSVNAYRQNHRQPKPNCAIAGVKNATQDVNVLDPGSPHGCLEDHEREERAQWPEHHCRGCNQCRLGNVAPQFHSLNLQEQSIGIEFTPPIASKACPKEDEHGRARPIANTTTRRAEGLVNRWLKT